MAEAVATVVAEGEASTAAVVLVAEVSTAVAVLAAGDFTAGEFPADTMAAPMVVITAAGTAMDAVLTAATAPMAAEVPTEECAAPAAPTIHGHRKVGVFATHPQAGTGLRPEARVVGCLLLQ